MTDSHVHVGWFVDRYHSPDDVTEVLRQVGVDSVLISSTSTCAEEYELVIHEFEWLQEEWGENIISALWVTPRMLKEDKLRFMLDSGISWNVLKMHWQAHPELFYSQELVDTVFNYSEMSDLPILLHTGGFPECEAKVFQKMIENHPERKFILAHGRPLSDIRLLLQQYRNVWIDTAFMPISDILVLIDAGCSSRILWGSDAPINEHFYPDINTAEYLTNRLDNLKQLVSHQTFTQITESNFHKFFNLEN